MSAKTSEKATAATDDTTDKGGADGAARGAAARPNGPRVVFDTSDLKSSYCNVCNGSSTREEVVLNFGVNNTWDRVQDVLEVALHHRVVMSPQAALRVRDLLVQLVDEHERRHGKLGG